VQPQQCRFTFREPLQNHEQSGRNL
jgi:hypothetical protein